MQYLNNFFVKIFFVFGITSLFFLNACGIWNPADARKIPSSADERVKKNLEEGKGVTLMGGITGRGGGTNYQFASSNPMWRATLELTKHDLLV